MPEPPKEVKELVDRYERERKVLESGAYGEADTRKEFIEPLFTALGWDVVNRSTYSEAYKDVVNEYSLKIGGSHKAPDYAFRVGGNRVLFVEAKRPSIDISKDAAAAYQLRWYGWTAKLPISVLTNFRHLAVYDCTQQPSETDRASAARTLLVPWKDLVAKWPEVGELLGKKSVYQGSLQRYFDQASRRRGTSEVDGIFLLQMEEWRKTLAQNIAKKNPAISVNELNEAVQQTLDRIVFLRIAEDRGIEPYGELKNALKGAGVYSRLLDVFRAADTRYNSGLFYFKAEKGRSSPPDKLTPGLIIEDKALRDIVESMYYPASPYEFSVMPADILGQVYEQFLGKVIRLTDKSTVVVEDKPELGLRLFEHTRDRLTGRWDRFSWFGVRGVRADGELTPLPASDIALGSLIATMEALLIEGLEPPQNRRQGEGFNAVEFIQETDPDIAKEQQKSLITRLLKDSGLG